MAEMATCRGCNGRGQVKRLRYVSIRGSMTRAVIVCSQCGGTGQRPRKPAPAIGARARRRAKRAVAEVANG